MKEFRIDVFGNRTPVSMYFDNQEDAESCGSKKAHGANLVILLRRVVDNKYDVVKEIRH